jgi:fatty acid desaturase
MSQATAGGHQLPIPGGLNLALAASAMGGAAALLWAASQVRGWLPLVAIAVVFSYVNNTVFSLLHEAVHGMFHRRRVVNDAAGLLTAAFFPTGFTFQRICHLGHHRRNRTDDELFDYLLPGESRWWKSLQWYGILTGVYWLLPPLACLVYLLWPGFFRLPARGGRLARQSSAAAMAEAFAGAPDGRIRLEILGTLAIQATLAWALDLTLVGWLTCYAAFAVNWSSLQYADHAWSARDRHEGAWNLRVSPLVRAFFLNYHDHKAHHQHPTVPWRFLPRFVDPGEPRPSFWQVWLTMWRGPRRWPDPAPPFGPAAHRQTEA